MVNKTSAYDFFIHPFSEGMPQETRKWAQITFGVLTICTAAVYAVVVLVVNLAESLFCEQSADAAKNKPRTLAARQVAPAQSQAFKGRNSFSRKHFVGREKLKQIQAGQLRELQRYASNKNWEALATHTRDKYSGFDWWMFMNDRESDGQGCAYKLSPDDIEALGQDEVFMESYRAGVTLVALSWGWDLETRENVETDSQKWRNYTVRLRKMTRSLWLFKQEDLLNRLRPFMEAKGLDKLLNTQVQAYFLQH